MSEYIEQDGWKLLTKENAPVLKNSTHKDFRGEAHTVTGGDAPLRNGHRGKSGYIYTNRGRFFPTVLDMKWVSPEGRWFGDGK